MLLIMILEPNIKSLAFNSFLQMNSLLLGYFNYMNKLNFCVACIIKFILLIYSLAFYLVIFSFVRKSYAKVLLNITKFKASSFFIQGFTRIMRNFINSFFHAYFIFDYRKQIIGLMASQTLYIILSIYFRKSYSNVFIFLFSTLYYVLFLVFNAVLVAWHLHPHYFEYIGFDTSI